LITETHYENFPVGSRLLPKEIRPAIWAIYAFSRLADDFADEAAYKDVRLQRLTEWQNNLTDAFPPTHPVFIALHDTIVKYQLPVQLFTDLLTAFRMDVMENRYQNFDEVLFYCRHSANPIGRLVLQLFGQATQAHSQLADKICTALQLTNFCQDIGVDINKDRIYLPLDEMERFDVTETQLRTGNVTDNFKRLMSLQIERTREIFVQGKPLGLMLPGKLGLEIRLTWLTGVSLLKKIVAAGFDVFQKRPTLTKRDFVRLFFVAACRSRYERFKI
jgi:phytoene synthase